MQPVYQKRTNFLKPFAGATRILNQFPLKGFGKLTNDIIIPLYPSYIRGMMTREAVHPHVLNILLADDDLDDCLLFKEALEELPVAAHLTLVHDGEQLMLRLTDKKIKLPDILFLDINMPRKNGLACLSEIKHNEQLQKLPVIIFSTSFENEMVSQLYKEAAHYYIRKPAEFAQLRQIIQKALTLIVHRNSPLPKKEKFLLTGDFR